MTQITVLATLLVGSLALPLSAAAQQIPDYLYVWGTATDTAVPGVARPTRRGVVLLTVDLRSGSATHGQVTNALLVDTSGRSAHHTEHALASDRVFFANDFGSGRTFRFDLRTPGAPKLLGHFTNAGPFVHPHSYVQLPNGNMLVTYQGQASNRPPGGIAEVRRDGTIVRWARATAPGIDSAAIMPYSLEVIPALDRVVTTSTSMVSDVGVHVQIWRLSDLALLHTLEVPAAPKKHSHDAAAHNMAGDSVHHLFPGEPRLLEDGRTVMLGTFTCGLYVLNGLDGARPQLNYAHSFPGENCAVPVRIGKWWVQTVPGDKAIVTLDVTNPAQPREVSRVIFANEVRPHWLAADAAGRYLVMNSGSSNDPRLYIAGFDAASGRLTAHTALPAVELGKVNVPGLGIVRVEPHGTVFQ